ncbi:hypothetical protein [Corynebacterium pseudodiphtheriticum]|uniref:hypothetical protein n=1 Tax=Corynebacterium pseudodiphtheriticum TaxID=37637 RepID=UPI002542E6A3|nr:hypothetical protein [Corynebacterium pseudodiphtheriticum]MDK4229171.1 hypothetical protein [Corynebacterium pseudodiphtheriticum]
MMNQNLVAQRKQRWIDFLAEHQVLFYIAAILLGLLGLRVKMCVWLGVSRGLDLAFLNAD